MEIKEFLHTFHLDGLGSNSIFQVAAIVWLLFMVWKFLLPSMRAHKGSEAAIAALTKEIDRLINEAIRRAPPIEDPKEGVPFEVYRKDLHRMVDGELSIDEFVDIWRGRKVQKRPTAAELQALTDRAAKEKAQERPMEEELRTRMGRSFLAEWEAHLDNHDPVGFAELFMLNLNEGSEESRQFHSRFVAFMKSRIWDQALEAIRPAAKWLPPFQRAEAGWFYSEFRGKVLREIEAYWSRFLVPKSGHRHEWAVIPPIFSGVRLKCACGEVREGQVGAEGPRCATGSWLGPTGPYGATGTGYPTPTGMGYPYGMSGISGGGGSYDHELREEVRRLRQESDAGKNIFSIIEQTIKTMSADLSKVIDLKNMAGCPPGAPGDEGWMKYAVGQWVRVIRPTSPAVGQIGRISEVKPYEIRVFVHSKHDDSFAVGVSFGEFEPALPKVGEWWRRLKCGIHQGMYGGEVLIGPDCEWWLHPNRLEDWNCGCIEPVNFGRGE